MCRWVLARVVFNQGIPPLPPHEVEHRTSWRIKRQAVLHGKEAVGYTAIIHEAALRMQFGGPSVARAQLRHLLDMASRDNVNVVVIPFSAGEFPGAGQTIFYAHGQVHQLDTVQLDQSHGPVLLDMKAQLEKYRVLLDRMERLALDPPASREFIHDIIDSL